MRKNTIEKEKSRAYQADRPIQSRDLDRFGRWPFAERIADTIGRSSDPSGLVMSIYGAWGDGKSSVLNLMEEALKKYNNVIVIRFNPWYFRSEPKLINGFFETLADKLDKSLSTKKVKLGKTLKAIGLIASLASGSFFGGVISADPGGGIQKLGERLAEADLDELRKQVEGILEKSGKRIVVLIDDIDRLDKEEIQAVFKLVKLSGGFNHVTYVLAFDDEMVASALSEKYGGGDVDAGRKFIEKIIQVPLHLPAADSFTLRKVILDGIQNALTLSGIDLDDEQSQRFVNEFFGIQPRVKTPRQAKRYVNALTFALPILKGEVNTVDHMLIEGLRVFYPNLYTTIRDNPEIFLGHWRAVLNKDAAKRGIDIFNSSVESMDLDLSDKEALQGLIDFLFPRFGQPSAYGQSWDEVWTKEKRACSPHYFQRYFGYGIPPGDVADQAIESFFSQLEAGKNEKGRTEFKEFLKTKEQTARIIEKLRYRESQIPLIIIAELVMLIVNNGEAFPGEDEPFTSTFSSAAVLVSNLVARIPDIKIRKKIAKAVIEQGTSLAFSIQCFTCLRQGKEGVDRKISIKLEKELGSLIVKNIVASTEPPYLTYPKYAETIFWVWGEYGVKAKVRAYLKARLSKYPSETIKFLVALTPNQFGGGRATMHKAGFRNDAYAAVADLVDVGLVLKNLKKIYGKKLDGSKFEFGDEITEEHRIANQFAFQYQRAIEQAKEKRDSTKDASTA